jgi:predicted nucleotidyltransferase component of viral defense system
MIPSAYISEWRATAPWISDAQVEHDLVIERAILAIYSHPFLAERLAFRGGTALHKLIFRPQARYSEDIDLVQLHPGGIGPVLDALREALSFLPGDPQRANRVHESRLIYRFESEIEPVLRLRLKVEINTREHRSLFGIHHAPFVLESRWHSGATIIRTYEAEELLGTKLRALFQRKKGRDLFDLWYALTHASLDTDKIIQAFLFYLENEGMTITRRAMEENLDAKLADASFAGDLHGLLRPEIRFDQAEAAAVVRQHLISRIP